MNGPIAADCRPCRSELLPAEIDMYDRPDYVHVAAGTIREKVRRMVAVKRLGNSR